jgi:hypothetical protein
MLMVILSFLCLACENGSEIPPSSDNDIVDLDTSFSDENTIESIDVKLLAKEYEMYLRQLDFLSLEELNNGEEILLSPYVFVDTTAALHFTFGELEQSFKKETKHNWGYFDGTGEVISMAVGDYLNRFVMDVDYSDPSVELNIGELKQRGNSISNLRELFPAATFVEFYRGPVDADAMGMDWRALILVFQDIDGELLLKAIVHNEWTI